MSVLIQQEARPKRLRDYGAFQTDLSAVDTLSTRAIETAEPSTQAYANASPLPVKLTLPQKARPRTNGNALLVRVQQFTKQKKLRTAARLIVAVALLVYLFNSVSWQTLLVALTHVYPGSLLVGLIIGSSGVVLSAYQWWGLLRAENIRFDLVDLIKLYIVGVTFNHFLPTGMGGDAFKAFYVGRESRNSIGATSAALLCRITGFIGMLCLVVPVLIVLHARFTPTLVIEFAILCLLAGTVSVGTLLLTFVLPGIAGRIAAKNRFLTLLTGVGSALHKSICTPRSLPAAIARGAVFWLVAVLNCYAYADALGMQGHLVFYFLAVPLVAIVACLPVTINGFGVREGVFVYVFSFAHVAPATALLLVFLLDLQSLFFAGIGCVIYFTQGNRVKSLFQYPEADRERIGPLTTPQRGKYTLENLSGQVEMH
jgi:glycosyltransferase 2 family protein